MLAATRQLVMQRLDEVPRLVDRFSRREAQTPEVLEWFSRVEQVLTRLRSPLASMVASERGRVVATPDGLHDPEVREQASGRKALRAMTAVSLSRVERALREMVGEIDHKLDSLREKLASFLAAASGSVPIPLPPECASERQRWLHQVWATLGASPETRSLYAYLNASMSSSDRFYLLDDVLTQMLDSAQIQMPQSDRDRLRPLGD